MRRPSKLATLLILFTASGLAQGADEREAANRNETASPAPEAAAADAKPPPAAPAPTAPPATSGEYAVVDVADPYLEFRTGPGRGYPVTHVVGRGGRVEILKRRTDWFRLRDDRGREGWVSGAQLERTLLPTGEAFALGEGGRRDFERNPWEAGALFGDFGGGNVNTAYVGYAFNEHLSAELAASQVLGRSSNAWLGTLGLFHTFRPDWRLTPFAGLGTGVVNIQPKGTIVSPPDRTEQVAFAGAGVKYHLGRNFVLRAEFKGYVIFTEREENEEREEWKVGFAFFF